MVDSNSIQASESKGFKHVSCIGVNLDGLLLQSRNFRDKVQSAFTFFFLQLKRNTSDGSLGNSSHQMSCVPSDLVSHSLRRKDCYLIDNTLVGMEVECESSVVFLDNSASTLLDSLRTDTLQISKRREFNNTNNYISISISCLL